MTEPQKKKIKTNYPPAPPGNKLAVKLKDPDVRQEAYDQYCTHIASGLPKQAFFFDHPTHSVSWETMDRYIAENPSEFPAIKMEQAKSARYKYWLSHGSMLMRGKYKGGSPTVWTVIMRNIFKDIGWDREQIQETNKAHVQRLAESIRGDALSEAENGDCEEQCQD
jgi:hypothetical protein